MEALAAATPAPERSGAPGGLAQRVEDLEARVAFLESVIAEFGVTPSGP